MRLGAVRAVVAVVVAFGLVTAAAASGEGERRLDTLERELAELRALVETLQQEHAGSERLAEIERRIEILAAEIDTLRIGEAAAVADASLHGFGPAASKVYRAASGVSLGGYGEMLYQNFDSDREDGTPSGRTDELDLLRAVFYFGYKFDDRFLFNSEIEFEHASTEEDGAVSVEFAYLDYLWREAANVRAGLVLLPMGLTNELHEPTVFSSSLRPETERRIIPSTWRENGVGLFGDVGPITYRAYLVNGLDASGFSATGLRDGRQNGSEASAEDLGWVGRIDYVGRPGLTAGGSAYFGQAGQGLVDGMGRAVDAGTSIIEAHVDWRRRGLRLRALAARARVRDAARLDAALGLTGAASVGERMVGSYVEAGFDVLARRGGTGSLTPFVRVEHVDTQDRVPAGFQRDPATDDRLVTLGLAYQPRPQLIFKVDFVDWNDEAGTGVNQFNASIGYVF